MAIRIGTSGWSYPHWEPELYPPGLPAAARLGRYTAAFGTAERSSSFYRWPRPQAFRHWRQKLPGDFCLSVKAPRGLTHGRKLYGPETWLQRIGAGWHELGDKRAVLLAQLGPAQPRDDARLAYFLRLVPEWMRLAVEFRHSSWHCEEVFALLEAHRAAYCVMSGAHLPCVPRATADFPYVQLTAPITSTCTRVPIARPICPGGRPGSGNGTRPAATFSPTSTTTARRMPCGTPAPCASTWASRRPGECRPRPAGNINRAASI